MSEFVSIIDQIGQADSLDGKVAAGLSGMTSVLSGASDILGKMGDLNTTKNATQYDVQLNAMRNAGAQNYYTTDSLMQDALTRPTGYSVQRNALAQSDKAIAKGVLGSTLTGATTGLTVGGPIGAAVGAGLGLIGSGISSIVGRNRAHKKEQQYNDWSRQEQELMDRRYVAKTDNVNEYQMDSIFANRAAEGGKIQTKISMSDYANKVLKKRPYAAGGFASKPSQPGTTHGGFYTPGIIRVNSGGFHEENPNGGVQYGMDQNGVPNLVEQDETIWDDYVFSNRLKPSKKNLKEFGLPEKYSGMTFARISDKLAEEADMRPNDATSKRGMDAMLARLEACQEQLKAEKGANNNQQMQLGEAPLPPGMEMALAQQQQPQMDYGQMQQMGYDQAPQMGYDQMPQMGYEQTPQMGINPTMAAYGGSVNTFDVGGDLNGYGNGIGRRLVDTAKSIWGLMNKEPEPFVPYNPKNFVPYQNDPYLYGEITPSYVEAEGHPIAPIGEDLGIAGWMSPEGAMKDLQLAGEFGEAIKGGKLAGKLHEAKLARQAAKLAKSEDYVAQSDALLKKGKGIVSSVEKSIAAEKKASEIKAAEKAAEKALKDADKLKQKVFDETRTSILNTHETAVKNTKEVRRRYDQAEAEVKRLSSLADKTRTQENLDAYSKAEEAFIKVRDELTEATKAENLASLKTGEKEILRAQEAAYKTAMNESKAVGKAGEAAEGASASQAAGQSAGGSEVGKAVEEGTGAAAGAGEAAGASPKDRSLVKKILFGNPNRKFYNPLRWGVVPSAIAVGATNLIGSTASKIYNEQKAKGKKVDDFDNPLPPISESYALGGPVRKFYPGGVVPLKGQGEWPYTDVPVVLMGPAQAGGQPVENGAASGVDAVPSTGTRARTRSAAPAPFVVPSFISDEAIADEILSGANRTKTHNTFLEPLDPLYDSRLRAAASNEQDDILGYTGNNTLDYSGNYTTPAYDYSAGKQKSNVLPTAGRYAGALESALAYLDTALSDRDYSISDSYKAMMNSAPHRQVSYRPNYVAPGYNPADVEMANNQAKAAYAAGMRQMANSGAGPSMMAVAPMMGYNAGTASGAAMAQSRLANEQAYLNHVNAMNQLYAQMATGDYQAQAQNANLQEYANQFSANMLDRSNYYRDAEDTARAQAISTNAALAANNIANIGKENFSMNQINSNPALMGYLMRNNGVLGYNPPAACGGKRKTKKK